ncbi:hypothetical protein BAUCODRAFT_145643 [Baudoinia panamericana UAMH 10762]|uniref:Zn(2)-C6 fungal-type domain-containing protein n=1 Tax=Baudoinia panamericana (strain UAMH 10762) TaxID=717646 RepID=M2NGY7_BAUPA|nr:uncharacterized protein BAUCODRAFT_145643 [Baudoinia panamericana UAMH 10762]EMC98574.1 hypothetical protein BAUCODRAFT_145643 [Baudoinia panamericana UAMH 10762]
MEIEPSFPQAQTASNAPLAPLACATCRKQKRKCDKQLPSCSLCLRIGRPCDYTEELRAGSAPSPEDFNALRQEVAELRNLLTRDPALSSTSGNNVATNSSYSDDSSAFHSNGPPTHGSLPNDILSPTGNGSQSGSTWPGPSSFPSLFFLDSNAFEYERFQIQAPYVRVPPGALSCLGSSTELRAMIEHYFDSVHSYFPIVSKIRLYQHLSNPLHEPGADIALLFMSMKLACNELPDGTPPQSQLYQDVKSFYHYIEAQNGFSIQLIQALALIGLYETGHAIYPAAYLTIGHAARLGIAMGIHERSVPQMLAKPTTWTEQEERRRVWWGVIVLDRYVNIGNKGKPFASADPSLASILPTDDASWDRGQMLATAPLALSASTSIRASPFARTCQASHLLGKVLRHINDKSLPLDYRFEEALQLSRTVRAFAMLLPEEAESDDPSHPTLCTSMALCYSAILELFDAYSCTERAVPNAPDTQVVMQEEAIRGISDFSAGALTLARRIRSFAERVGLGRLSPLVLDALYQATANYAWYVRESSDPSCAEHAAELKEVLVMCDRRWKVAGEYIRIIEATEFALASSIR